MLNSKLKTKLRRNQLIAEFNEQKQSLDIINGFFASSNKVDSQEFSNFSKFLPSFSKLMGVCWHSADLKTVFTVSDNDLCSYFDIVEPEKIVPNLNAVMHSIYTQDRRGLGGFATIFISLNKLLQLIESLEGYYEQIAIFNNATFSFIQLGSQRFNESYFDESKINEFNNEPIATIGQFDVFYYAIAKQKNRFRLNPTEWLVCILSFLVIFGAVLIIFFMMQTRNRITSEVRKKTADLERVNYSLQEQSKRAENLATHKQKFLANMSHEIRTPMNGVLGVAQLLAEEDLSEKQAKYVKTILESGNLMLAILNDILDQLKFESGKIELEKKAQHIEGLLHSIADLFQSAALMKQITISVNLDPKLPQKIICDPFRLKQVLSNIVSNSVKFTTEGGISLEAHKVNQEIEFSVKDTGIGISHENISDIFKEFTQADTSTTRQFGGTGLGLSIAYNLVALMGGELKVESTVQLGSRFYFRIPLIEAQNLNNQNFKIEKKSEKNNSPSSSFSVKNCIKILVVEDNKTNAFVINNFLDKLGCQAETVENGKLAVEQVKIKTYDLIFMDCQMPVMDGITATREIRKIKGANPIIIALTADAFKDSIKSCFDAGMNAHLAKPVKKEEIRQVLEKWFSAKA